MTAVTPLGSVWGGPVSITLVKQWLRDQHQNFVSTKKKAQVICMGFGDFGYTKNDLEIVQEEKVAE